MTKDTQTRSAAVAIVGESAINELDGLNCEPVNRVGYQGRSAGDELQEWSASLRVDVDGDQVTVTAYYYITNDDEEMIAAADGDAGVIDWRVAGYEIA